MSSRPYNSRGSSKSQKRFVSKGPNQRGESTSNASFSASLRQSQYQAKTEGPRREQDGSSSSARSQMGSNGSWVSGNSSGSFVRYLPQDEAIAAGLGVEDGGLDSVESQRVVDLLNKQLSRLLKLNAREFWREVVDDTSLHEFLDSYLQFRSRWYDFPHHEAKGMVAGVIVGEHELSRRVFMVLYRISSNKDHDVCGAESLSAKEHRAFLQEKKLLDLPRLLDICAVYGHENEELTKLLVDNAIKAQPTIVESLTAAASHFLTIVHTMEQRCNSLSEVLDSSGGSDNRLEKSLHVDLIEVLDFINDAVASLDAFVDAYKPAAIYFSYPVEIRYGNEELLTSLARLHDVLLPSLRKAFTHSLKLGVQNWLNANLSDIATSFGLLSRRIIKFGWKLVESCYLSDELFRCIVPFVNATKMFPANVEDPAIKGDIVVQIFREIVTGVSSHLQNPKMGTFLQNLEKSYELLNRLNGLRHSGWLFMDDEQFQYLSSHISVPFSSISGIRNHTVPTPSSRKTMENTQSDEDAVIVESKISQIKDIFPDYGKGFLSACLDVYNQNVEEVIQRILEGTLHEVLLSLDTSLEKLPPKSSPTVSRTDKGKRVLESEVIASSDLNITVEGGKMNGSSSSSISSAPGRFVRKSKDDAPDNGILDSKTEKELVRSAVLAAQYDYEDEYDDSFDELGLGLAEPVEETETLGDKIESVKQSSGIDSESKPGWWDKKKSQFFVKDGKNYSYKISGSVAVSDAKAAARFTQAQKDLIYGLGRGGNIPYGGANMMMNDSHMEEDHEVPEASENPQSGKSSFRGRGRGATRKQDNERPEVVEGERQDNSSNIRGRGRGRGGGNHYRKDRAMKKHFVGLSGR